MARFEILGSNWHRSAKGRHRGTCCSSLGMNVFGRPRRPGRFLVSAHKWFNLAAVKGNTEAIRLRREIANQMSDAEIAVAQRAARDWLRGNAAAPAKPPAWRLNASRRLRLRACGRRTGHLGESRWRSVSKACSDRDLATPPVRKARRELLLGRRIQYEAGELQAVLSQERFDVGNVHLVFLDVEHQVATFVGGEEIAERDSPTSTANRLPRQNLSRQRG